MSHLTDVIEEEADVFWPASYALDAKIESATSIKDIGHLTELKDQLFTQAMTKAALAVIEEIKKNSEEAVPRLWYVSESTFETLKAILTTPKE